MRDGEEATGKIGIESLRPVAVGARDRLALVALVGEHGRPWIPIDADSVIGRDPDVDVRLDDAALSRRHARIFWLAGAWRVEDLGSINGTFVDGQRLTGSRELEDGARLQIGRGCVFRISLQDSLEREASRRLYESTVKDPLTGLHNRRHLDARLEEEVAFARRHGTALSVLLLDVDHFKRVNDTHGHQAGDAVLQVLSALLTKLLRTEDLVARYGGEEIAIAARGTDAVNALILADRIRRRVEAATMPWGGQTLRITVSIGVATWNADLDVAALLGAADAALYRAKAEGRNRCCVA